MDKCALCHLNSPAVYCKCKTPPVPVCLGCLLSHKAGHLLNQGTVIPRPNPAPRPIQSLSCLLCPRHPIYVCGECIQYICSQHPEAHKSTCPNAEMLPMEMSIQLSKPNGRKVYHRAKVIDCVIQVLTDSTEKMKTRVKEEIEDSFTKAFAELDEIQTQVNIQVEKDLAAFHNVMEGVKRNLEELKTVETFEPRNGIEELLLTASKERILDVLHRTQWAKVILKNSQLQFISSMFYTVEFNDFCLLVDPISKTECGNRLILLPESQAVLFDLESQQHVRNSAFLMKGAEGMSFLTLPSNEIFMCGGNFFSDCYLLSCRDWNVIKVATLHANLRFPGLVYYRGRVYIIGGTKMYPLDPMKEIQCYNRKQGSSSLLPLVLHEARTNFCPCVWQDFIYIAGGEAPGIEVFDPLTETIRKLDLDFEGDGPSVLIPFSDQEILILCKGVFSFRPKDSSLEIISTLKDVFASPIGVTKYKDTFFFMERVDEGEYQLMSYSSSYDLGFVLSLSIPRF